MKPAPSMPPQHLNSAVPPPTLQTPIALPSQGWYRCLHRCLHQLPLALILQPDPEVSCPAPHHSRDLHTQTNVALVTFSPSFPIRAGYRELGLLSLNENNPVTEKKPIKRQQQGPQHAIRCDGSSKLIHSLPHKSINIVLFSAITL